MNDHIVIVLTAEKLKAIGEKNKDSHLSALLLWSLPPSYVTLITALDIKAENELISKFRKKNLTEEFQRMKDSSNSSH